MSASPILTSLPELDQIRRNATDIQREEDSNVDILVLPKNDNGGSSSSTSTSTSSSPNTVIQCHLSTLLPFTYGDFVPLQAAFEYSAAIALAAHQLNVGDGSIIPILEGLNNRCDIKFSVSFEDTQFHRNVALDHVVEQIGRTLPEQLPCAFVGADTSAISRPTSIVTSLFGYPQMSGASTSEELDDVEQHPLFGRTIPSDADNAIPMIKYLRLVVGIRRLAVIHIADSYGTSFMLAMRRAARVHAPDMEIAAIPLLENGEARAIQELKQTGFNYVFCLTFTTQVHDTLLQEAYNNGVAGDGKHNWFFGDSFADILTDRSFVANSPLHQVYQGVGMLEVAAGLPGETAYETFKAQLAALHPDDLQYLGSLLPHHKRRHRNTGRKLPS